MTREEIKRLADALADANATLVLTDGTYRAEARYLAARDALHAAIDAIPLGNLTDAALEGVPSPSAMEALRELYEVEKESMGTGGWTPTALHKSKVLAMMQAHMVLTGTFIPKTRSGPADNAGSNEPEGNSQ